MSGPTYSSSFEAVLKATKDMRMMMERMIVERDKHNEGSRRRERNYENFPSHEKSFESSHHN